MTIPDDTTPGGDTSGVATTADIEKMFQTVLGRAPSASELVDMTRLRDAMRLRKDDALWLVLIALEDYDRRYRAAPKRIEQAVQKSLGATVNALRTTADQEARRASAAATERLAEEAARIARDVARSTAGASRARWMLGAAVACTLALMGTGGAGVYLGHRMAVAEVDAAAAWAASAEGRLARQLSEFSSITRLARCDVADWIIHRDEEGRRICYPDGAQGWFIP